MQSDLSLKQYFSGLINSNEQVPQLAKYLGYAGLIPFVAITAAIWSFEENSVNSLHQVLLSYAAIILSFMGAIHWGLAMASAQIRNSQLGFSVFPPLIAWFASFAPMVWNYSLLILTFILLCAFDLIMHRQNSVPQWYPLLRIPLSVIVVFSLITAQTNLLF